MSVTVKQAVADKRPSIRPTVLVAALGTLLGAAAPASKPVELKLEDVAAQVRSGLNPDTGFNHLVATAGEAMVAFADPGILIGHPLYPEKPVKSDNHFVFLAGSATLLAAPSFSATPFSPK